MGARTPTPKITLEVAYEPAEPGLVELRPRTPLPSGHESLSMTFLQPLGRTWPVKPKDQGKKVPHLQKVGQLKPSFPPEPLPYGKVTGADLARVLVRRGTELER